MMKDHLKDIRGPDGGKTLVIEQGGRSLLSGIQRGDPFRPKECRWKENCYVDTNQDCMQADIVYQIKCLSCHNPQASPGEPELQGGQESDAGDIQGAQAAVQLQEHQGDSLKCVYFGQSGRPIHARMEDH